MVCEKVGTLRLVRPDGAVATATCEPPIQEDFKITAVD
eukprot:SAG31_NODE_47416_length_244_cov_11.489655_2_plen_37_part_01